MSHDTEKRLKREEDALESRLTQPSEEATSRLGLDEPESSSPPGQTIRLKVNRAAATLREIEDLFSSVPMMDAPAGFADRVMALISDKAAQAARAAGRRRRFRWPWFMLIVALFFIGGVAALALGPGPRALAVLVQDVAFWLNDLAHSMALMVSTVSATMSAYTPGPFYTIGVLAAAGVIIALWTGLMAYAGTQRQQVVYQVPVRFH